MSPLGISWMDVSSLKKAFLPCGENGNTFKLSNLF
jgi:hypothetical protein